MADVDLYGGDAEQIRNQYRQYLGRDASNDEVSNWLSGAYGGSDLSGRLNQIATSGEAQARQPTNHGYEAPSGFGTPESGYGPGGVENPAYTSAQGNNSQIADWYQQALGRSASQDEINNWLSGAYGWGNASNLAGIKSGIYGSGEAQAYAQRPTGQTGAPATGATGGFGSQQLPSDPYAWFMSMVNGKPPTPETLESLAPQLAQYGIKLGSKGSRGWTDTIIMPDGRTYDVIEAAGIGQGKSWTWNQNGGQGYVPQAPGSQYSDPYTQFLEMLMSGRIKSLMQPVNDPNRAMYEAMLQQRASQLGQATSQEGQLMQYLQKRFEELQGSGYTGAENEVIRTGALDPIETDRQAARKRVMERLSARGLTPDSGIAQQALLEVDKAFDAMRATTQTALTTNDLNRREDRKVRAQSIGGALMDIPQQRQREQLDVFGALNQLSLLARQEDEARQREAVGYGGALADLGPQRLQLAMQAAGMGGQPSSMFSNLMQLAGLNQNAAMYGANNQASLWNGLGSIAAILANSGR